MCVCVWILWVCVIIMGFNNNRDLQKDTEQRSVVQGSKYKHSTSCSIRFKSRFRFAIQFLWNWRVAELYRIHALYYSTWDCYLKSNNNMKSYLKFELSRPTYASASWHAGKSFCSTLYGLCLSISICFVYEFHKFVTLILFNIFWRWFPPDF